MEKRTLGRTGHESSVVIFGAAAFWEISQEDANATLDAVRTAGVNHIDVAPQYGQAEARVGAWLPQYRDEFFLGCKTLERMRDDAWAELHRSLKLLNTQQLDLYQLHAITSFEELNAALAPGGAIDALKQARDEGLTRYLGITGHGMDSPRVFLHALEHVDFDTIMFPINPALWARPDYRDPAEELLSVCRERNIGVMVIKSIAKEPWGDQEKQYTTWYKPFDHQDTINQGVDFALSQAGVTGIASAGDTRLLPMVIEAAQNFTPLSSAEQQVLIDDQRELEMVF